MSAVRKAVGTSKTTQSKKSGSGKTKQGASATRPKKSKSVPILFAIKPLNMDTEKKKFFDSGGTYDPQFVYGCDVSPKSMLQYGKASDKHITQALKIISSSLEKFGSYSNWEKNSGGAIMTRPAVHKYVTEYLETEGMADEVQVNITHNILSHASMTRVKGKPTINIKEGTTHQNWIDGMLNHELGTHYLRAYNNGKQPWKSKKRRRKLGLLPANPTEEGLASLNTHIHRDKPVLLRSSILYVAVFMSSKMSFSQVNEYMKQYVDCSETRWKYIMRAKRGQTDTSLPGCFPKDQVYLTGALQILSKRAEIDFDMLYRCGKISYKDVDRLCGMAVCQGTRLPKFISDRQWYIGRLDFIMEYNGLTDADLTVQKAGCK